MTLSSELAASFYFANRFLSQLVVCRRDFGLPVVTATQQEVYAGAHVSIQEAETPVNPACGLKPECDDYPQSDEVTPTHGGIQSPSSPSPSSSSSSSSPTITRIK